MKLNFMNLFEEKYSLGLARFSIDSKKNCSLSTFNYENIKEIYIIVPYFFPIDLLHIIIIKSE
jgi:hypothetical protein